ncbi:26811_t:CDS:2, partial [Gigaspora margarita]
RTIYKNKRRTLWQKQERDQGPTKQKIEHMREYPEINQQLQTIEKTTNLETIMLTEECWHTENCREMIRRMTCIRNTLHKARQLETQDEETVSDSAEILEKTRKHFCNWTKYNPINKEACQVWEPLYKLLGSVNRSTFELLLEAITSNELMETIKHFLLNKAMGHSEISNEVLRKLPQEGYEKLLEIFNNILRLQMAVTKGGHFGRMTSSTNEQAKLHHFVLEADTNKLKACRSCKMRDKTLKNKKCHFTRELCILNTIQVNSKGYLHTEARGVTTSPSQNQYQIMRQMGTGKDFYNKRLQEAFKGVVEELWNKYNIKKTKDLLEVIIKIDKTNMDSKYEGQIYAINNSITITIQNPSWPSEMKTVLTSLLLLWTIIPNKANLKITTNCRKVGNVLGDIGGTPMHLWKQYSKNDFAAYYISLATAMEIWKAKAEVNVVERQSLTHVAGDDI